MNVLVYLVPLPLVLALPVSVPSCGRCGTGNTKTSKVRRIAFSMTKTCQQVQNCQKRRVDPGFQGVRALQPVS